MSEMSAKSTAQLSSYHHESIKRGVAEKRGEMSEINSTGVGRQALVL
ncbi:hypothetical protein Poly51_02310 [Rubripirellula tenax]|uniref:Uncharacterized protein n=1 Tax=Rubripirellula tenax TaxID=2528015 RepID=A0A5C6FEX9_9BACT|nr:hypothetical protein Poly51_02310 [Rubripirellula tenax]